jgi:hypothetical protein
VVKPLIFRAQGGYFAKAKFVSDSIDIECGKSIYNSLRWQKNMDAFFVFVSTNLAVLTALAGVLTAMMAALRYFMERAKDARWKEFDTYHKMVKDFVQAEDKDSAMMIDRQCALIYEFRFFRRYYPQTLRMFRFLKAYSGSWQHERIQAELEAGINAIDSEISSWRMRLAFIFQPASYYKK